MVNKRFIAAAAAILVPVLGVAAYFTFFHKQMHIIEPKASTQYVANQNMGFLQRANSHSIDEDITLVYVDATWAELENEKGVYDFQAFDEENQIELHREAGRKIVFRLVLDEPDDELHMDIPQWLYDETGDGAFYDISYGKGYSPDYGNEALLKYHRQLLEQINTHCGDMIAFVELGTIGHWGEWHVKYYDSNIPQLPKLSVLEQYALQYVDVFGGERLLMRRPFYFAAENGMGLYNDMTADYDATTEWLSWIENGGDYGQTDETDVLSPMAQAWRTCAIGGEIASGLDNEDYLNYNLDQTLELLRQSHMTFIGPNYPHRLGEEYDEAVEKIKCTLGYRLRVEKVSWVRVGELITDEQISITFANDGAAPLYEEWPVCAYIINSFGEIVQRKELSVKGCDIMPDKNISATFSLGEYSGKNCTIALAIEDPQTGSPTIAWAMDGLDDAIICRFDYNDGE